MLTDVTNHSYVTTAANTEADLALLAIVERIS